METVSIARLKDQLSRYLRRVERGGRIVVYRRDRPVAEIVPFGRDTLTEGEGAVRLRDLERAGVLRRGTGGVPDALRAPPPAGGGGVLAALIEERRTGR